MSPGNGFLALNVLIFAGLGVAGLVAPEAVLSGAGVLLDPGSSTIDLRATYGGAILGFAAFLICCMGGAHVRIGLAAVFCLTIGFLAGRLLGLAVGEGPALMWQLALVEALWSAFAAWLWLRYPHAVHANA